MKGSCKCPKITWIYPPIGIKGDCECADCNTIIIWEGEEE